MNRLKDHNVYLIGSIDHAPDGGIKWRKEITPFLHSLGVRVFNPCNKPIGENEGPDYSKEIQQLKEEGKYDLVVEKMKDTVGSDLHQLDLSSFIICYLDMDIHTCGTYCEITYAALEKKPILIMCKQGVAAIPNFVWGMGLRHELFFDNWEDLKKYLSHIHTDEKIETLKRWRFINYDKT